MLITAVLLYIQSASFARTLRAVLIRHLPPDGAIEADFTDLAVKFFPPGLSIRNPRIYVRKPNLFSLPPRSSVQAERIDFIFTPFQMLSGNIRLREIAIQKGDLRISAPSSLFQPAPKPVKPRASLTVRWEDLLDIRTDAVSLQETRLTVDGVPEIGSAGLFVPFLRVGQWNGPGGPGGRGYELNLELNTIEGGLLKRFPALALIWRASATAHVNSAGASVDSMTFVGDGFDANGSGQIQGDPLVGKGLGLEGNLNLNGDAGKILHALETAGAAVKVEAAGNVAVKARFKGSLDNLAGTLTAEGELTGRDLDFHKWRADQLHFKGGYANGWLNVESISASQAEQERVGGFQPGKGGHVTLGAFKFPLTAKAAAPAEGVHIPLALERAHINWLGAGALKDVYPIAFRATGPVDLIYFPPSRGKPWSVVAKPKVTVENFLLDNQRLGKTKALKRILRIPKIEVSGEVALDAGALRPNGLILALPSTRLQVGGKVDFKTGFDLTAAGIIQLQDLGEIAENEIRGSGTLSAHVHGPSSDVILDFDVNVQEAAYLHLAFGEFQGRVTWDDGPDVLRFTNVQLARGKSVYGGNGSIDLHDEGKLALDLEVPKGDVQDFIQTFDFMTRDIGWFPRTLTGPLSAKVKLRGGIDMRQMEVQAAVTGTSWEYLGERFKSVTFMGGYDKGRYFLENLAAVKRQGAITGRISYTDPSPSGRREGEKAAAPGLIDWDLQTRELMLSDLDHISQLDIPLRGKLAVRTSGKGSGTVTSETSVQVSYAALRGRALPDSSLSIKSANHVVQAVGNALGGQGALELNYDLNPGVTSQFRLDLKQLDFSPVVLLVNPSLLQDESLAGVVSGGMNLKFRAAEPELSTGQLELSQYVLAKSGARFDLVRPVSVSINEGNFDLRGLALRGNAGEARLELKGRRSGLDGQVLGRLDMSIVEFLTSTIQKATGTAALDYVIGGTLRDPTFYGRASLEGASVQLGSLESPFENISGTLQVRQNILTIRNVEGELAGGRVAAEGQVTLFASRAPQLNIKGTLGGNRLKVYPFQYARVRGGMKVHGEELPYLVEGSLVVDSALCKEKVLQQKKSDGPRTLRYTPNQSSPAEGNAPNSKFKLNIEVVADKDVLVKNDLFDAELRGKLKVVNTLDAPRILGNVELIQGRLIFKDRVFTIQSASGVFDNPTTFNPSFNLTANTDVNGIKIQLYAAGRVSNWKPELTSNPVLPESEILSLLALGITANDAKKFSAGDRSAIEQGEAASLLLNSLDFNREVQDKTGFQIQLDESVNTQTGTSAFRPQSQSETTAAPKIVIRKKVGDRLTLSAGSTVGVGTNQQKEANAEFHVNPGFSVLGVFDQTETVDAQDRKSIGVDLKWQKRFH